MSRQYRCQAARLQSVLDFIDENKEFVERTTTMLDGSTVLFHFHSDADVETVQSWMKGHGSCLMSDTRERNRTWGKTKGDLVKFERVDVTRES